MFNLPEELKALICSLLPKSDLKNLRIANPRLTDTIGRILFDTLHLWPGWNRQQKYTGYLGGVVKGFEPPNLANRRANEFSRFHEYLPTILPIATFFTRLEYAPVVFEPDLLSVRIGTHSGNDEDFIFGSQYCGYDWSTETGKEGRLSHDDPWVDKDYVEPPRHANHKRRIAAAALLQQYVEEQTKNHAISIDALKKILYAMKRLNEVVLDSWVCNSFEKIRFYERPYKISYQTMTRRHERGTANNINTLIPLLRDAKHKLRCLQIPTAPVHSFIHKSRSLLGSLDCVVSKMEKLYLTILNGTRLLSPVGETTPPGTIYKILDSCRHTLKFLSLSFNQWDEVFKNFGDTFGVDEVDMLIFPQLEELSLESFIITPTKIEAILLPQKSLRRISLRRVILYTDQYDWVAFFGKFPNAERIQLTVFHGLGNTMEPEKSHKGNFLWWDPVIADVPGWKLIPRIQGEPVDHNDWWVRENSSIEFIYPKC